jgi:hypothetical protein
MATSSEDPLGLEDLKKPERPRGKDGRFIRLDPIATISELKNEMEEGDEDIIKCEAITEEIELQQLEHEQIKEKLSQMEFLYQAELLKQENLRKITKQQQGMAQDQKREYEDKVDTITRLQGQIFTTDTQVNDLKVAKPKPFSGQAKEAREFMTSCEMVFLTQASKFDNLAARLYYILSYCTEGIAKDWRDTILADTTIFLEEVADLMAINKLSAGKALKEAFLKVWIPATARTEALTAIQTIKQGTDTVEEYTIRFRNIKRETDLNDEALVIFYTNGLKEPIKQRIYDSGEIPATLSEWIRRATIIDNSWRTYMISRGNRPTRGRVRVFQGNNNGRTQLTPEEFKRRRENKLCFRCGQGGHMANKCNNTGNTRRIQIPQSIEEEPQEGFS